MNCILDFLFVVKVWCIRCDEWIFCLGLEFLYGVRCLVYVCLGLCFFFLKSNVDIFSHLFHSFLGSI